MSYQLSRQQRMRRFAFLLSLLAVCALIRLLALYGPNSTSWTAEQQEANGYANVKKGWNQKEIETANNNEQQTSTMEPMKKMIPMQEIQRSLYDARQEFDNTMQGLYGQTFFPLIFHRVSEAFEMQNITRARFLRRLTIKLLNAYLYPSSSTDDTTVTWITGGHSNAAAHGNLYNQSYTASLERYAQRAFQAVGLDFVAKNYAMGGYSSGVEISLCLESVYGKYFDFYSWDFGMTDGQDIFKLQLLLNRIATAANSWSLDSVDQKSYFPIVLVIGANGPRRQTAKTAEDYGMATFLSTPSPILDDLKANLPDASILDQGNLTEHLAYFLCSGNIEANEPCFTFKYRTNPCANVKGQVSWHDGWKLHHLYGAIFADLMIQMLQEAVDELAGLLLDPTNVTVTLGDSSVDPFQILFRLQEEEKNDLKSFLSVSPSASVEATFLASLSETIALDSLTRKKSICHTALLPSQARYDGLVIGTGNRKSYLDDFDTGVSRDEIIGEPIDFSTFNDTYSVPRTLPLAFDKGLRNSCEFLLKIDYKDVFLVKGGVGWVSAVVPNDSEIAAYGPRRTKVSSGKESGARPLQGSETFFAVSSPIDTVGSENDGLIVICLEICDWNSCPASYISFPEDFNIQGQNATEGKSNVTIEVDGKSVTGVSKLHGNCFLLEGEQNGFNWGPGNEKGQYEMKFNVDGKLKHLFISSIIVI